MTRIVGIDKIIKEQQMSQDWKILELYLRNVTENLSDLFTLLFNFEFANTFTRVKVILIN